MYKYFYGAVLCLSVQICFTQQGIACDPPTGIAIDSLDCSRVIYKWTHSSLAMNYEYCVDLNPTNPIGPFNVIAKFPNPSITWTGLVPNTRFYIHMRSLCGSQSSAWTHFAFTTPDCATPQGFTFSATDTSALLQWAGSKCAKGYEYTVNTTPGTPQTAGTFTTATMVMVAGLTKGTKYYAYIRTVCDSFTIDMYSNWTSPHIFKTDIVNTGTAKQRVHTYPNPVVDVMHVEIENGGYLNPQLRLFSPDGRLLSSWEMSGAETSINMSQLPAGLYFLWYDDGDHKQQFKVLKL